MTSFSTEEESFWAGEFGDEYLKRPRKKNGDLILLELFSGILSHTRNVSSVIEYGASKGRNLLAIRQLIPSVEIAGVEINQKAFEELSRIEHITAFHESILSFTSDRVRDLAFTMGLLIHINPEKLPVLYDLLYGSSSRYICIAEYYNPTPVEVVYRGHRNRLFKRDFAADLLDRFNDLRLIEYSFVYHRDPKIPLDDITWFLLEKKSSGQS